MSSLPPRYWRSYGNDPLPSPAEALASPLRAFPSWFLRMECAVCGKERYLNEVHAGEAVRNALLRDLLPRLVHKGCGRRPKVVELVTGLEATQQVVRRVRLRG